MAKLIVVINPMNVAVLKRIVHYSVASDVQMGIAFQRFINVMVMMTAGMVLMKKAVVRYLDFGVNFIFVIPSHLQICCTTKPQNLFKNKLICRTRKGFFVSSVRKFILIWENDLRLGKVSHYRKYYCAPKICLSSRKFFLVLRQILEFNKIFLTKRTRQCL